MALDGMFLYQLRQELAEKALDARVDRIHQPTREEIIIALRWKGGAGKAAAFSECRKSPDPFYRGGAGKSKTAAHVLHAVAQASGVGTIGSDRTGGNGPDSASGF